MRRHATKPPRGFPAPPDPKRADQLAREVVERYAANVRLVQEIGRIVGFQPIFCWQPTVQDKRHRSPYEQRLLARDKAVDFFKRVHRNLVVHETLAHNESFHDLAELFAGEREPCYIDRMNADAVARLEERRRQEIAQAIDAVLAEGDTPTVQRHLQTIDACAKLLSTFPPERKRDWLLPAGVAIACLAVASSLWTLRVRHTDVAASLETASLTGTLAQPWSIADTPLFTRIKVERPSKIDLPSLGLSSLRDVPAGEAWVTLEGDAIALETVEIAAGTRVDVEAEKGEIVVYVRDAPVAGKVTVQVQG